MPVILTSGQLAAASAVLQTGGGTVAIRLHNTNSVAETVILTVVHGGGTAVTVTNLSLDAGASMTVNGLPLGPTDVLSGYATDASKVDYFVVDCPPTVPFGLAVFDSSGSIKSGGSTQSVVDFGATGRITTKDSVASGDARIVGGLVKAGISTTDTITAATSNNAFVSFATTYVIPANTIKAGTVVKVRLMVDVVNAAAGTATLTINLRFGGTSVIATTAIDPAQNDWQSIEFTFTGRAAPGAAAAVVGVGRWNTSVAGTNATKEAILQSTNFATNGALTIDCQAKWSAADATTTAQLELFNVEIVG